MNIFWEHWSPPLSHGNNLCFWNNTTTNNLYGFQIGADGKLLERGRFSIDGLVKAGIFDNNAEESTEISDAKQQRPASASTNHAAFVGETGLQCQYQVTKGLLLKAGYEVIWLQGVALAPDRFRKLYYRSGNNYYASPGRQLQLRRVLSRSHRRLGILVLEIATRRSVPPGRFPFSAPNAGMTDRNARHDRQECQA